MPAASRRSPVACRPCAPWKRPATSNCPRRVWNELIAREHPRGAVQYAGAQLRYLLVCEHGALGFAAAALTLAARAAFIGWDPDTRSRHLHRVISLSRFLIGFGDVVTPGPVELEYPVLLDQPVPTLNAYP